MREDENAHSENNRKLPGELVFPHVVFRFFNCKVTGTARIIQKQKCVRGKGNCGEKGEKEERVNEKKKKKPRLQKRAQEVVKGSFPSPKKTATPVRSVVKGAADENNKSSHNSQHGVLRICEWGTKKFTSKDLKQGRDSLVCLGTAHSAPSGGEKATTTRLTIGLPFTNERGLIILCDSLINPFFSFFG